MSQSLLTPNLLNEARALARQTGRPMLDILETSSSLAPEVFVSEIARLWHYPALMMVDLHALHADFESIPYAEAVRKICLALRDADGVLHLVIADPFNADLQEWAEAHIKQTFYWAVAHRKDIEAC